MLLYFIHVHKCLYRLPGVLRFIVRSGNHIVTSLRVDNGLFNFFSGRKKTTNEASWSEINRNGLHSLEESLDLEDNSITVLELHLVRYVGIIYYL